MIKCCYTLSLFFFTLQLAAQIISPPPTGIFCSCGPTTGVGPGSVNPTIASKPFVKGILVRVGWQLMEPSDNQYNWSLIDEQIAAAQSFGKKISLAIGSGISIPQWVLNAGTQSLVTSVPFNDTIAVPWDSIYLDQWTEFISALGNRYQNDTTIVLVYMTHSTSNGYEMQLPFVTTPSLQAAGYTDAKMIQSWKTVINAFNMAFPNHYLTNDFHPVNGSNAVGDSVYAHAVEVMGDRYGASAWWWTQKNTNVYPAQYTILQNSATNNPFSGVQMAYNGTNDSTAFGPGGMPVALELAISHGVCYWEIWNQDILNSAFTDLLESATCSQVSATEAVQKRAEEPFLYPNPTSGMLHLGTNNSGSSKIQILSLQGEVVLQINDTLSCDLSGLAAGCYIAKVDIQGKVQFLKVIKM